MKWIYWFLCESDGPEKKKTGTAVWLRFSLFSSAIYGLKIGRIDRLAAGRMCCGGNSPGWTLLFRWWVSRFWHLALLICIPLRFFPDYGMPIQKLGYSTSQRLRSQLVIESVDTVVRELIQNGLDAGATSLRIKLDPLSLSVCVEDNGSGISPQDLALVGKRNYSSSYGNPSRRGEALCSIGFCCAHVVLRTKVQGEHEHSAGLAGARCLPQLLGVLESFFQLENVPSLGTQVMVSRVFSKLPVRRSTSRIQAKSDTWKRRLRSVMFEMLRGYTSVAAELFLLENGAFERVLKVGPCQSTQELFCRLFRFSSSELTTVNDDCPQCKFDGFFSLRGSQKLAYQYVFLNGRKLDPQAAITGIFNANGYSKSQRGIFGRSLRLFPLYCFDITHPQDDTHEAISFLADSLLRLLNVKKKMRLSTARTQSRKTPDDIKESQTSSEVLVSLVSMDDVAGLTVVKQILKQFILAVLAGEIFVLDQHACDERIRIEELFAEYSATITDETCNNEVRCPTPVAFPVTAEEAEDLLRFQTLFRTFGMRFGVSEICTVTHLPRALAHIRDPALLKGHLLQHVNDIREGEKQPAVTGNWIQDVQNFPLAIFEALVSLACRLSVKFGDILLKPEMEFLIRQLSECSLPFQCAHGRTTIVPLGATVEGFTEDEEL